MDPNQYAKGITCALLAAACASLVGIFAKIGMRDVPPVLATAVRSVVMMVFCIVVAAGMGYGRRLGSLHATAVVMIVLSGVAGAASWLFGFIAYDKIGVAKTSPLDKLSVPLAVVLAVVVLGERPAKINWVGVGLIVVGAYLCALRE
jgi:bacterial/archaeal transporter family protein